MSEATPEPFEVWRFEFEYEDQPGVSKARPVIIGASDSANAVVLIVKVTGHEPRPEFPDEVKIKDWQQAGLEKPSTARCSKTLIVPISAFRGARRYGHLSEEDASAIKSALLTLNKITGA